jgi:hypothetical protein
MTITNKYIKRSCISEAKFRHLLRLFTLDIDATNIAYLTRLNRNTINRYLHLIRDRIVDLCNQTSPFSGEIEVDESYFGARCIKGKLCIIEITAIRFISLIWSDKDNEFI